MSELLDSLVESYGAHDSQAKALKKECDSEKEQIKSILVNMDNKKYSSGGYTVAYSEQERVTMDEELMLNILRSDWVSRYGDIKDCPYLTLKVCVDADALENAIYKGELSNDLLAKLEQCRKSTKVQVLKCYKTKKQED